MNINIVTRNNEIFIDSPKDVRDSIEQLTGKRLFTASDVKALKSLGLNVHESYNAKRLLLRRFLNV